MALPLHQGFSFEFELELELDLDLELEQSKLHAPPPSKKAAKTTPAKKTTTTAKKQEDIIYDVDENNTITIMTETAAKFKSKHTGHVGRCLFKISE